MCIRSHSESGQPCGFSPCERYLSLEENRDLWKKLYLAKDGENAALRQERDRLAGIVEKADALANASEYSYMEPDRLKQARNEYHESRHG